MVTYKQAAEERRYILDDFASNTVVTADGVCSTRECEAGYYDSVLEGYADDLQLVEARMKEIKRTRLQNAELCVYMLLGAAALGYLIFGL